jgi:phosphatidylglycerol:prolipoprotein diacylglycerol transferase
MKKVLIFLIAAGTLFYFLHKVFSGAWILPQFFQFGPLTVHYYGIFLSLGIFFGYWLARKRMSYYGLTEAEADNIIFWLIIGSFVGARLYHVVSDLGFYIHHPLQSLEVWKGGLSIYGALLGGVAALFVYRKILHLKSSVLDILDWLAPSLALGQIIGRFGNLFNYELYGYPTGLPWKMFVPEEFRSAGFENRNYFHPLFLYEAIGNALILFFLLKILKIKTSGLLFFWYLLLYNSLRFFLEFLRIESVFVGHFRQNAAVSLLLALFSAAFLLYFYKNAQIS